MNVKTTLELTEEEKETLWSARDILFDVVDEIAVANYFTIYNDEWAKTGSSRSFAALSDAYQLLCDIANSNLICYQGVMK